MTEDEKKKTANLEDVQAFGRIIHNKGIGSEGTCSTAAATAAKTVTVGTTFKPVAGATLIVTFQNAITVANATLAVTYGASGSQQTLAAKPIYYRGSALAANLVEAGATLVLRYDGTNYNIIGSLQIDPFPSQSGNSGKFLKTDGSAVSWADIPSDNTKTDKLPMAGAGAATENNFMAIDANGNIKDSGKNANSFLTQHQSIKTINGASIVGTGNVNLQTPLTFDSTPTANSNNPVTSGGIKSYIDPIKQNVDMLMLDHLDATTVIMTSESNSVAMAICYAQGWASSSTQMTYGEAQAVTDIGTVFMGNTNLTHFEELQYFNIYEIKDYAFNGCTQLTMLGIPPRVSFIGTHAFTNTIINKVYIRDLTNYCNIRYDDFVNWENNPARVAHSKLYLNNVHVVDLNIPAGVTGINTVCLRNMQFNNVTIPSGCHNFIYRAFGGCVITGDVFIDMPIKEWCENSIIYASAGPTPISIAQGDIYILYPDGDFFIKKKIEGELVIPNNVTNINRNCFQSIKKITKVVVPEGIGILAGFVGCSNLTDMNIPSSTTIISIADTGLSSVTVPKQCMSTYGDFNAPQLHTIMFLGSDRTDYIYLNPVSQATTKVYVYAQTAPYLYGGNPGHSGTLYVPANSTGYDSGYWKTYFLDNGWTLSKTL